MKRKLTRKKGIPESEVHLPDATLAAELSYLSPWGPTIASWSSILVIVVEPVPPLPVLQVKPLGKPSNCCAEAAAPRASSRTARANMLAEFEVVTSKECECRSGAWVSQKNAQIANVETVGERSDPLE